MSGQERTQGANLEAGTDAGKLLAPPSLLSLLYTEPTATMGQALLPSLIKKTPTDLPKAQPTLRRYFLT